VSHAFIADKVRIGQHEGVALLQRALDEKRGGALRSIEMRIRIDAACLCQVLDDARRIRDAYPAIFDEGQLALRFLARIGRQMAPGVRPKKSQN
jgi:hypothetical protein